MNPASHYVLDIGDKTVVMASIHRPIIRPHRPYTMEVIRSVVCVCLCVLVTRVSSAKTAEPATAMPSLPL